MELLDPSPSSAVHAGGEECLIELDRDHPGFRDQEYRARRNEIARQALAYRDGEPVPSVRYIDEEHAVWRTIWDHLGPLHAQRAARVYLEALERVQLDRERIPQLGEVNEALASSEGFRMLPVAGLVASGTFLDYLGRGVFLSTQYIRHHSLPLYTPEPDVVHELVGHAATLVEPNIAALNRAFGRAVADGDSDKVAAAAKLYWYTLEFGLIDEDGEPKALGAGLLSSFGELGTFERRAVLRPFRASEAAETDFDPTDYQRVLFVARSFGEMIEQSLEFLAALDG